MSVANGAFTRTNSFGQGGAKNYPRFHTAEVEDRTASEIQGRPIFRTVERVEIFMPGNPLTRPVAEVTEEHKQTWPEEYKRFKDGMEMSVTGTPLEEWPRLKRAMVLELKALGFLTVEHVAAMDDLAVQRIGMGGMGLRNLAKAFLDEAESHALTERLTAQNDRSNAENAELREKIKQMGEQLDRVFGELQGLRNAPHPLQSHVPGLSDPVEQAKAASAIPAAPAGRSALDDLKPRGERKRAAV